MRGQDNPASRRKMTAAAVVIMAVLLIVISGFIMLNKRQESLVAHARDTNQEEATIKLESPGKESGDYQKSEEITAAGAGDIRNKKKSDSGESGDEKNEIYLVKGEEKKSNKYERADKLSYTDCVKYTRKDLDHLDEYGLRITRNEIFARHGRMFNDQELQKYFDSQPWYVAKYAPGDFDDSCLNDTEVANVELIVKCELERGYNLK